jgi:hypothetical protein
MLGGPCSKISEPPPIISQILELPRHEDAGVKIVGNGLLVICNGIVLRTVITDIMN